MLSSTVYMIVTLFIIGTSRNRVNVCASDRWFAIQPVVPYHVRSPVNGGNVMKLWYSILPIHSTQFRGEG
jgi:hypothetical protein